MTMMHNNYGNHNMHVQVQTTHQGTPASANSYQTKDDSIYSTTPFGGGSVFSPSVTALQPVTPRDPSDLIYFDFPPELRSTSSIETSSSSSTSSGTNEKQMAMVPYYSNQQQQQQQHYQNVVPAPTAERMHASNASPAKSAVSSSTTSTALVQRSTNRKIYVPRSNNPYGADAIHPKKNSMKKQRKRRTAAGTVGGMAVGGLVLGPVGVVVGGMAGGVAAHKYCKARERRAQRKYEQQSFQQGAIRSSVCRGSFV